MEQDEALLRSSEEKKEEEAEPAEFFLDLNCVIKNGNGACAMKFTDGTTKYYVLTQDGVFFNLAEEEKEKVKMFGSLSDSFDSCYLVPSDVILEVFPDGDIPLRPSNEYINKINKSNDIVELKSSKKDEFGRFVFTATECVNAIEKKKKRLREKVTISLMTGFFIDPNSIEFDNNIIGPINKNTEKYDNIEKHMRKFTDGTKEYYILDEENKQFYYSTKEKAEKEKTMMFNIFLTSIGSYCLVPPKVVFEKFSNRIPIKLSQEDFEEIKKGNGVVKLESSKKDKDGKFIFESEEIIKTIEEKRKQKKERRQAEEAKRKAEGEARQKERQKKRKEARKRVEEERKKQEETTKLVQQKEKEVKPTGFFLDPDGVVKYDNDNIGCMLKFTDGTTEYCVLYNDGIFITYSEELAKRKNAKICKEFEKYCVDSVGSFCLIPSEVISRTFPNKNIPEKLSWEDFDKITKSDNIIQLEPYKEKGFIYNKLIITENECIEAIKRKKEGLEETAKRFVSVYADGGAKTKKDIYFKDGDKRYYLYRVTEDSKVEHINTDDLKYDTSVCAHFLQDGTMKIDFKNGLSLNKNKGKEEEKEKKEDNYSFYISTSGNIRNIKKSNGKVTGATKLEYETVEHKKSVFNEETEWFEEKSEFVNIFTQDEIKKAEEEEKIKTQERKEERKRQEEIVKPTQQKEEESKSKISKSLSAFSGINQKEADNSPLPFKTQGATKDLQR